VSAAQAYQSVCSCCLQHRCIIAPTASICSTGVPWCLQLVSAAGVVPPCLPLVPAVQAHRSVYSRCLQYRHTVLSAVGACSNRRCRAPLEGSWQGHRGGMQEGKNYAELFSPPGHHFRARHCNSTQWGTVRQKTLWWKCCGFFFVEPPTSRTGSYLFIVAGRELWQEESGLQPVSLTTQDSPVLELLDTWGRSRQLALHHRNIRRSQVYPNLQQAVSWLWKVLSGWPSSFQLAVAS